MTDADLATQLPLFEGQDRKFFARTVDELPASWLEMPEEAVAAKIVDFTGRHLALVAPPHHRDMILKQEVAEQETTMDILARRHGLVLDDVRYAYAGFSEGKLGPEIFSLFVEVFDQASEWGIVPQLLEKIRRAAAKPKKNVVTLHDRIWSRGSGPHR